MARKTRLIVIRVSPTQFELIKNNAEIRGFKTISSYLREKGINDNFMTEQKINEMHKMMKKLDGSKEKKWKIQGTTEVKHGRQMHEMQEASRDREWGRSRDEEQPQTDEGQVW